MGKEVEGVVIGQEKNFFYVDTILGTVQATLGGKIRKHSIKIVLGDEVRVEVSPYDMLRGRIVRRLG